MAATVTGLFRQGKMSPRVYASWLVRLADMFLQAGSWATALRFVQMVPPGYLRDLPEDAEADPELAARAHRVAMWLHDHVGMTVPEAAVQVYTNPGRA